MSEHDGREPYLTLLVRRFGRETGIDPTEVRGTGSGGRVTRHDMLGAIARSVRAPAPGRVAGKPQGTEAATTAASLSVCAAKVRFGRFVRTTAEWYENEDALVDALRVISGALAPVSSTEAEGRTRILEVHNIAEDVHESFDIDAETGLTAPALRAARSVRPSGLGIPLRIHAADGPTFETPSPRGGCSLAISICAVRPQVIAVAPDAMSILPVARICVGAVGDDTLAAVTLRRLVRAPSEDPREST